MSCDGNDEEDRVCEGRGSAASRVRSAISIYRSEVEVSVSVVEPAKPPETDELANEAQATLDLLRRLGWYKGGPEGPDGSVCVVEAIIRTSELTWTPWQTASPLYAEMQRRFGQWRFGWPFLSVWNDAPERTFSDVEAALQEFGAY